MSDEQKTPVVVKLTLGLIVPLLICGLGYGFIVAVGSTSPEQIDRDGDDPVSRLARISSVSIQTMQPYPDGASLDIEANGVVVPFRQVTLAAEVAGKIKSKSPQCQIGRFVKEGEILYAIDKTDYELDIERLTALRDSERAQQKEWEQDVANAKRLLELAAQDMELQEKEMKRLENLPKGFASETELDQARKSRLASENQKLGIQNQLEALNTRRARTILAERLVEAQLEQAKVNLARTEIRAPISGVITNESTEVDSYVQKGATLCMIEDTQQVEISCNLRPDQMTFILDQVEEYGEAEAEETSDSYELPKTPVTIAYYVSGREDEVYEWHAHLSRYEGIGIDQQSRTVPVRITVENPREFKRRGEPGSGGVSGAPNALVRGMFVDCLIHTKPRRPLALLPKLGLRPGSQVWQFVRDDTILTAPSEKQAKADSQEPTASKTVKTDDKSPKKANLDLRVEDWVTGRLKIVNNIKVVRPFRSTIEPYQEFWVIEAQPDLGTGSQVITSPLTALQGDGSDLVRYQVKETKP